MNGVTSDTAVAGVDGRGGAVAEAPIRLEAPAAKLRRPCRRPRRKPAPLGFSGLQPAASAVMSQSIGRRGPIPAAVARDREKLPLEAAGPAQRCGLASNGTSRPAGATASQTARLA